MFRKSFKQILLLKIIASLAQLMFVNCNQNEVDITCSKETIVFEFIGNLLTCQTTPSLSVTNYGTHVRKILSSNRETVATQSIKALYINNPTDLKFLPSGIKPAFPKLKAIRIFNCDLSHLDQEDMKHFGIDIQWIRFWKTELTVLEGNLFKNNPNLIYVSLEDNPLKYISQKLFEGFTKMSNLKFVSLLECGCIEMKYESEREKIQTFDWTKNTCNDISARNDHLTMSNERFKTECVNVDDIKIDFKQKVDEVLRSFKSEIKNLEVKVEELTEKLESYGDISSKFHSLSERLRKAEIENDEIKEILF